MKRKTKATPANTPRSRSNLTRRQRIYGYRVPAKYPNSWQAWADVDKNEWEWGYVKVPTKICMRSFLPPTFTTVHIPVDICTVTPMESKQ